MAEQQKILTDEQKNLVAELTGTYGIDEEDIIFFEGDKQPFLFYEANAVLCRQLANLAQIGVEPVYSPFDDAIAVKCTITTSKGYEIFATGVVNTNETINGVKMSDQQILNLANSRALRNTLRAAGIDLIKMHYAAKNGDDVLNFQRKAAVEKNLAEAHILGAKVGLISGSDKTAWYALLRNRYGVASSRDLTEAQRADFVAFLRSLNGKSEAAVAQSVQTGASVPNL